MGVEMESSGARGVGDVLGKSGGHQVATLLETSVALTLIGTLLSRLHLQHTAHMYMLLMVF